MFKVFVIDQRPRTEVKRVEYPLRPLKVSDE